MNIYKITFSALLVLLSSSLLAQDPDITSVDNDNQYKSSLRPTTNIIYYEKQNKVLEWEPVREIDVMWKKTVWREIDLRERMNEFFTFNNEEYGDGMLIEIILNAVKSGQVQAFNTTDDRFTSKMSPDQVQELTAGRLDTVIVQDPETFEYYEEITRVTFDPKAVVKYRIKEETYFDKVKGKMYTRIIGIAPLRDERTSSGEYIGEIPMFWLSYPELRPVLANHMVFNPMNDISTLTWDNVFEKRMFASNIIRMSGNHQMRIKGYKGEGLEAYYEAQRLQEELFNREQDLWVY